jgi:glutathione synthase/RimK-type ligase-like ATP-grasp enzyme
MTGTCLLVADRFEPTADLLVAGLRDRGVPVVRWNLDRFPFDATLSFRADDRRFTGAVAGEGRTLDLDDVASVWCRGLGPSGFPEDLDAADREFAELGARRALNALPAVTDAIWINHPERLVRAGSKPAQLAEARQVGLAIPPTLVSNDPEAARAFLAELGGPAIYKSLSQNLDVEMGQALYTGLVTEAALAQLDLVHLTPGIFQALVPKAYEVRATVIGERIFAARIDSQAQEATRLDWRHRPFDVDDTPIELPTDVAAQVHAFMAAFGLVYGAFDFIVTPEGRFVFLEVNPAGQYMWVEAQTGLPITAALVDALAAPCAG